MPIVVALLLVGVDEHPMFGNADNRIFQESLSLHTDRQLYISGETLWFSMALTSTNKLRKENSKIAYIELLGPSGLAIRRVKVELTDGLGSGAIDIPKEIVSGNYKLRTYTQAMRSYGLAAFAEKHLIVLNKDQDVVTSQNLTEQKHTQEQVRSDLGLIEIRTDRLTYGQRQKVEVEIIVSDTYGTPLTSSFSVAVAVPTSDINFEDSTTDNPIRHHDGSIYNIEHVGMNVKGRISSRSTNEGIEGVKVFLSFPGERALVYSVLTNQAGYFLFTLPKVYGPKEIVLQVEPKYEDIAIIELESEFHEGSSQDSILFVLPVEMLDLANRSLANASVNDAYKAFEDPITYVADSTFLDIPFYGTYDRRYYLDDYTRFPLPEFYFEVVPEVRVQGKYGEEKLSVINDWSLPDRETPALLLVDGVPVFDQGKFIKINNRLISSTQIVLDPFWLNTDYYDGIVEVTSFDKDARCIELSPSSMRTSFLGLLPKRSFESGLNQNTATASLPKFKNTLFWEPALSTDEDGRATFSFYTSDAIGAYSITVQALDQTALDQPDFTISVTKE